MKKQITHLLVIDDDTRIRELLSKFLSDNGFVVTVAHDAINARDKLEYFKFDLIVADIMMPGETGLEFTKRLREQGNHTPVLMLTARGDSEDRIKGLEHGADDYLPKPFEPRELLLRINNIISRVKPSLSKKTLFGNFVFDATSLTLNKNGESIPLSFNESILLNELCKNIGNTVSREQMAQLCGGVNERSIDVQITRLRSKIEETPKKTNLFKNY